MKKITMQQIADTLNCSKVTVHKAITGQPGVSEKLRKQILALSEESEYSYNNHRLIKNRKFLYINKRSYFLSDQEMFYTKILQALTDECKNARTELIVQFYENEQDMKLVEEMVVENNNVAGIFAAGQYSYEFLTRLSRLPLPVIFIDYFNPVFPFNYVYLMSYYDAYTLTCYAIMHGHRNIGYIGHTVGFSALTDRYFGYRKALLEYKLPFNKEWHINENLDSRIDFNTELPKNLPSVYICHCDFTAKKLLAALNLQKIRVPEDVSIISFDDTDYALTTVPRLTSMGVKKRLFATSAIKLMQRKLQEPSYSGNVLLTPEIIERESFRPKPDAANYVLPVKT